MTIEFSISSSLAELEWFLEPFGIMRLIRACNQLHCVALAFSKENFIVVLLQEPNLGSLHQTS